MRKTMAVVLIAGLVGIAIGVGISPFLDSFYERFAGPNEPPTIQSRPPNTSPTISVPGEINESFKDGNKQLRWETFPGFSPDQLESLSRADTPEEDGWVGRLTNKTFGGFASLAYSGDENFGNYSIEAWVYVNVVGDEQGPLNGIAIRVDPQDQRFYRLAAQFGSESKLTLAYVGKDVNNFPVYLKEWNASEIPGGPPAKSGWHKMKIRAVGKNLWAYWDGQELPGCPVSDDRIDRGYFGVYTNFVGGQQTTETLVDGIIVREER